jgi:DeoR/GlpR family transcriptional regulator of sugar metabolism
MLSDTRRATILSLLNRKREISVMELHDKLNISIATVRRDLSKLEKEGLIKRTHGGAVLETRSLLDFSYLEREKKFTEKKRLIASKAAELIESGDRIFLNDGSTMIQIAKKLVQRALPIAAMTNSIKVAEILLNNPNIEVIVLGGNIREFSFASSGPLAEMMVESLFATKAIISADAFHPIKGISIQPLGEAILTKKMVANSENVIAVGDSSKINTIAAVSVCKWKAVDTFVTDSRDTDFLDAIKRESVVVPRLI